MSMKNETFSRLLVIIQKGSYTKKMERMCVLFYFNRTFQAYLCMSAELSPWLTHTVPLLPSVSMPLPSRAL